MTSSGKTPTSADDHRFAFLGWAPDVAEEHQPVPVTVISGFLGSGKTTLLKHLLTSRPGGRFGLVVNDVGAVNIDADDLERNFPAGGETVQVLSELTQGCICCSIGDELADAMVYLWEESRPAHILIEASGAANPRNILQTFYTQNFAGHGLLEVFKLSNLLTVVDTAHFLKEWDHALGDRKSRRRIFLNDPRKPYLELIMEQIETCDVLVLNKQDQLDDENRHRADMILTDLNPRAHRIHTCEGKADPAEILDTPRFDLHQTQRGGEVYHHLEQTEEHPEPHGDPHHHHHDHHGYGLTTVVFRARRPARQRDLFRVLRSELPGVLRAKGFYWTAEDPEQCGILSLAGGVLRADRAGLWFIDMLRQGRAEMDDMPPTVRAAWQDQPLGDRRQEIVLIGVNLNTADILTKLGNCLTSASHLTRSS
jgi:G3E family GTPase